MEGYEDTYKNGTCIPKDGQNRACDSIYCHRGNCLLDKNGQPYCDCIDPMYKGEFCDQYICAGYCLNGGFCSFSLQNSNVTINCSCRQGFEGPKCQYQSSDCSSKCSNHSTCSMIDGQASCHCYPGFQGDRCDQCASNDVCQNGGQCIHDEQGLYR